MGQRSTAGFLALVAWLALPRTASTQEGDHRCRAPEVRPADFEKLHRMIRRQPGEQKYLDIRWVLDPWEARKKAAEEGKPIMVFSHVGDALGHL